jgi:hypothetical protein
LIPWSCAAVPALSRALLIGLLSIASAALPAGLAAAAGPALELVGADAGMLELSLDELEAMPQSVVATENEFSDGVVSYRGPLVRDVLALVGLDRLDEVRFTAANDYFVDIPTRDFSDYDAILAMEADGEKLSRREKGPLWLMYPISDHAELRDPIYMRRLIWQVTRIERP